MITGELFDQEGGCLREGADAFLVKPFSRAALFDSIKAAVAFRRAARVLRGARILHVEDDDGWAELTKLWLSSMGAMVKRIRGELVKRGVTLDYRPRILPCEFLTHLLYALLSLVHFARRGNEFGLKHTFAFLLGPESDLPATRWDADTDANLYRSCSR